MDRIATLTKLWPFARPTLIRWIIGAMLWLAAHYGITGLAITTGTAGPTAQGTVPATLRSDKR